MLVQSALSCDTRKFLGQPYYRALSPTPPPSSESISGSLLGVSRKLQTLLNVSPGPSSTPPRSVRLASPFHHENNTTDDKPSRTRSRRITRSVTPKLKTPRRETPPAPPRTRNKRSRSVYEGDESDNEDSRRLRDGYTTPKRRRHFPYHIPLGLGIADFESLDDFTTLSPVHIPEQEQQEQTIQQPNFDLEMEAIPQVVFPSIEVEDTDKAAWTAEEDEKLVEMVLEKFKLSKRDWEECARLIGKDNASSVGKRWQALLGEGNIGLRRGTGPFVRGRLDGFFDRDE